MVALRISRSWAIARFLRRAGADESVNGRGSAGLPARRAAAPALATRRGFKLSFAPALWTVKARPACELLTTYAKAGITSRANSSTVCGGAKSANIIVNIVMPHATRSRNCLTTSSGVPFIAVNENGLRPLAISHF